MEHGEFPGASDSVPGCAATRTKRTQGAPTAKVKGGGGANNGTAGQEERDYRYNSRRIRELEGLLVGDAGRETVLRNRQSASGRRASAGRFPLRYARSAARVPFERKWVRFVGDGISGGEGFLLRSKQMRGDFAKVPDDAEPGQQLERVIGDVDFPPEEALASGSHVVMVIVVPAFSEGEDGEKPVVAAGVRGFVAARAKEMRERIDGEGIVPEEHGAQAETPEEQRPAADEPENHGESYRRDHVVLVQPAELGKFGEVADVVEAGLVVLV